MKQLHARRPSHPPLLETRLCLPSATGRRPCPLARLTRTPVTWPHFLPTPGPDCRHPSRSPNLLQTRALLNSWRLWGPCRMRGDCGSPPSSPWYTLIHRSNSTLVCTLPQAARPKTTPSACRPPWSVASHPTARALCVPFCQSVAFAPPATEGDGPTSPSLMRDAPSLP